MTAYGSCLNLHVSVDADVHNYDRDCHGNQHVRKGLRNNVIASDEDDEREEISQQTVEKKNY